MKKILLLTLVLLISMPGFTGKIIKTYHFSSPVISSAAGFHTLSFENTLLTGLTGQPALPYQDIRLLLPPGEEALRVTISFDEEIMLDGSYRIYPRQQSRPLSSGKSGDFILNEEIYNSQAVYPAIPEGNHTTHFKNGHSILLSSFTPVRYIPASGKISYFRKVTVEVLTGTTNKAQAALRNIGSASLQTGIANFIQNEEQIQNYALRSNRDDNYQILVITAPQFEDEFEDYRMLYLIRGMKTEIATTGDIASTMPGADLQEKIRNYIIQEYQEKGVEYVLLGGDVEHIPSRGFYCYVESGWGYEDYNIPADLYYSALDGTWNDDGDNMWGEIGEDDLLPDVSVARWPFSSLEQLQRLLNKTSLYQDTPVTGELQRPLMAGEHLYSDPMTWGGDYLDLLIGHHEDNGYTTDGIPESDDILKMYDRDGGWDSWNLINAVNQGRNFIHHSGHASETYVMRLGISDVTNANFNQANGIDHNFTLVYTHGCLCGAFDQNDCIGEAMVLIDNFAVAGAFNSRYGWFNEGQTEGPSQHLHREFVDALYDQEINRIGSTHLVSKTNTSTWVNAPGQWEEGALRWCFYACNILGDPALAVWTKEPVSIDVQYPEEILQGETSFTVTVTSNGQPAEGMMCVVMSGEQMFGCCATDASGQATIQIPGGFNGEEAELVVSGYHCMPQHYPLDVIVGIHAPDQNTALKIHPVPFQDHLTVDLVSEQDDLASITFYLSDGRMFDQHQCKLVTGMNSITLTTVDFPKGMVFVRIKTDKMVMVQKLIRQ
jgi:hypothetical protein